MADEDVIDQSLCMKKLWMDFDEIFDEILCCRNKSINLKVLLSVQPNSGSMLTVA